MKLTVIIVGQYMHRDAGVIIPVYFDKINTTTNYKTCKLRDSSKSGLIDSYYILVITY